jgi:DNA invertase Pin-like site-specific DNA recombinase
MLVGYARVSTREQNQALQLDALEAAGCGRVYTEKASGAQRERPELQAALDYARQGDTLVVWKLDRLARSIRQLIETVEDLERRKIGLRSLTEAIDTTTPHGEFLFNLFGSLAQYERALIKERVVAGLAAARRRGRKGGRPPTIDPEKVEQIIRALEGGTSKASVCRSFKVARSTLLDTLKRTGWTGPSARSMHEMAAPGSARQANSRDARPSRL